MRNEIEVENESGIEIGIGGEMGSLEKDEKLRGEGCVGRDKDGGDWGLRINGEGQVYFERGGESAEVFLQRCFPWSHPGEYISLRNGDGDELMLVEVVADLPLRKRGVMEEALVEQGFCFVVSDIYLIEDDFELRTWEVSTEQGKRKFQTAQDEWPIVLAGGGFLVRDLFGDLYRIPPEEKLSVESRRRLSFYID